MTKKITQKKKKKKKQKKKKKKKTHASVTVTVVRDRKIRTALRTNQIVEYVTVPAWKKKRNYDIILSW